MRKILMGLIAAAPLIVAPLMITSLKADEVADNNKRVHEAGAVLGEIMNAGDRGIPQGLLERAQCVGVVPSLKRAGFIVGAKYGKGVLTCRTAAGGWSAPDTIIVEGGSVGFQIGAGETDLVFAVMNPDGERKIMQDKFTVGGNAGVMAGPVGRETSAQTDAQMHAEILAWSRSRGLFGGISLEGATLRPDNSANERIYGHPVTQREILHGDIPNPDPNAALYTQLGQYPYRER